MGAAQQFVLTVTERGYGKISSSYDFRISNRGGKGFLRALFDSRDPTIPVVLLEDTGAVFGLLFAFVAVAVTTITGDPRFDAIGSITIGTLLCVIGVALALRLTGSVLSALQMRGSTGRLISASIFSRKAVAAFSPAVSRRESASWGSWSIPRRSASARRSRPSGRRG